MNLVGDNRIWNVPWHACHGNSTCGVFVDLWETHIAGEPCLYTDTYKYKYTCNRISELYFKLFTTIVHSIKVVISVSHTNRAHTQFTLMALHTSEQRAQRIVNKPTKKQERSNVEYFVCTAQKTMSQQFTIDVSTRCETKTKEIWYTDNKRMRIIETETDHPHDVTRVAH